MKLYIFKMNEIKPDTRLLTPSAQEHCKKPQSIAAACALTELGAVNLHYSENGKPLADNGFVSISHSGDMVAVALSSLPVGVDIEKLGVRFDFNRLASRFFADGELQYFLESPTEYRFLEIWTKKEAYSKITGRGTAEIFGGFDCFKLKNVSFETDIIDGTVVTVCQQLKHKTE